MVVGAAIQAATYNAPMMIIGRIISGIGNGSRSAPLLGI
jgi:hypothetical protein